MSDRDGRAPRDGRAGPAGARSFAASTPPPAGAPPAAAGGAPASPRAALRPRAARRPPPPPPPAVPEPVLARHVGRLARRNHHLHHGIYPLGSCTMKYNPVVDEQLASLDGFASLHPYQDDADAQGALEVMWELERMLCSIT